MIVDYFGCKFLKHKFSAIDGKTTVSFQEQNESPVLEPFRVLITQAGMILKGNLSKEISSEKELQEFAKFIADCWVEHRKLSPKLTTSLSGH